MPENPSHRPHRWPALSETPLPGKILVTAVLLTLGLAMLGALGQIIVHDIVPTFFAGEAGTHSPAPSLDPQPSPSGSGRGDLFSHGPAPSPGPEPASLLDDDLFVWTLRWSHIHLFGMNMIFFFLGAITLLLDARPRVKAWLVVLPFLGVIVDIAAVWLKNFVSPHFFWLHLPGGGLFATVFLIVFFRALHEMWGREPKGK